MRAIDGDALIKALVRKESFSDCARVVIAECMEEVRHAPTIEPEHKKGKWFHCDGMYSCSECHSAFYEMSQFCPNCGADMRGGNDEQAD